MHEKGGGVSVDKIGLQKHGKENYGVRHLRRSKRVVGGHFLSIQNA